MGRVRWHVRVGLSVAVVAAVSTGLSVPAASQSTIVLGVDVATFSERAAAWVAASEQQRAADLIRAIELGREAAAADADQAAAVEAALATSTTLARATTTTTAVPLATSTAVAPEEAPVVTVSPNGGPTAEQWAALRACESGGRYDAVSPTGRYRGAYQFSQSTWDWVASVANSGLVGVDPIAASVEDQDAQAQALYDRQGASSWPHCGIHLSS